MTKKLTLTAEDMVELKKLVHEHPTLVKKFRTAFDKNFTEISEKNPNGILIKPTETASATISSIASRMRPGTKVVDIDWGEVVFVGACVFTA